MNILKNTLLSMAFFTLAFYASVILLRHTGEENNSSPIFIVAVVLIARFTDGYVYGLVASALSVFFINYSFMYPYSAFTMSIAGYPVVAVSFFAASVTVSAVTTRMRRQTAQNAKLYAMQAEMKLETEKGKTRENLLRAISHDLRTPLTGIIGASLVIQENCSKISEKEIVQLAQNITADAQWLIDMVENLLSATRIGAECGAIKKKNERFEEIVTEAVYKARSRFPDCSIAVEVPEEILVVSIDLILIQQVVFNLIENAVKHSGDKEHIKVILKRQEDMAVFEVRDKGKGIPFENIDKLIENVEKNTEEASDKTRGLGLGLSTCRSIIKVHGGFLEAQNMEDGGAVFRFGLKLAEEFRS